MYISAISYSADTPTNPNISANSKPNSKKFQGVNQGPILGRLLKKNRGRQSRATVPLRSTFLKAMLPSRVAFETSLFCFGSEPKEFKEKLFFSS